MNNIYSDILTVFQTVMMIIFAYQVVYCFVALFIPKRKFEAKKLHKYAFVIAARNEENVIGNLIDSINSLDYPKELYSVFVVADNCVDNTAKVARSRGAKVYERFNEEKQGKGYALNFIYNQIDKEYGIDSFDGYCVFDADNLIRRDYLIEMNKLFDNGFEIITSCKSSKNFSSSWVSAGSGTCFMCEAKLLNQARFTLRGSASVSGTGYLVSSKVLEEYNLWNCFMLTEDIEFSVSNLVKGRKIAYADRAVFYDEQPIKLGDSLRQRLRWTKGTYQVVAKYGFRLFAGIFKGPHLSSYDFMVIYTPGFIFIFSVIFVLTITLLQQATFGIEYTVNAMAPWFLTLIVSSYALFCVLGAIAMIVSRNTIIAKKSVKIRYIFTFPIYMFTYVLLAIAAIFVRGKWTPIKHTVSVSNEEMENEVIRNGRRGRI